MGKSKKKRKTRSESLVESYQSIFAEFEKHGQDINKMLEKMGGKDGFYQLVQDIEDDAALDPSDAFRQAYDDNNIRRCVRIVVNIAKNDWYIYKRGLRKALYSEGNLLKNPLRYTFGADDYEKTRSILAASLHYLEQESKSEHSCISEELAEIDGKELRQLYLLYECMYNNRIQNEKQLNDSGFLKLSLPQILHSFLVFFQSQTNLARAEQVKRWKAQDYITGLESQVASERATLAPDVVVSMGDSFEQLLEDKDALFRYVFYIKNDETEASVQELRQMKPVTPYESPDYALLDYAALIDALLSRLEAGFRYSEWDITLYANQEDGEIYGFAPVEDKPYQTHVAGALRDKHKYMLEIESADAERMKRNFLGDDYVDDVARTEHFSQGNIDALPGGFFWEYLSASERMDRKNVESFHFEKKEYRQLAALATPVITAARKMTKPYYLSCSFHSMSVSEYLDAYTFLYTFSKVYYCTAVTAKEAANFIPLVDLAYLYNEFASLSGYKKEKAQQLIDCFVFDKVVAKNKKYGDIFTRPLVKVGSDTVLMSEALIDQINLVRNIEVLLDWNDVALAPMGIELEKKLTRELKNAKKLSVNTNKIKFDAYDGKEVEFDFIATIDDCLILMEMKSLLKPYDDDELYRRRKTISEGVNQIHRRVRVVQKNWDKIKELASIDLPNAPYDEEHIIKLVCTDVSDYTGLEDEDVVLTDEVTVLKYFTNPCVHAILGIPGQGAALFKEKTLWETGEPTAEEFIGYLHHPDTMDFILDCIKPEWKVVPVLEGYKQIAFRDMIVEADPWKKLAEKYHISM